MPLLIFRLSLLLHLKPRRETAHVTAPTIAFLRRMIDRIHVQGMRNKGDDPVNWSHLHFAIGVNDSHLNKAYAPSNFLKDWAMSVEQNPIDVPFSFSIVALQWLTDDVKFAVLRQAMLLKEPPRAAPNSYYIVMDGDFVDLNGVFTDMAEALEKQKYSIYYPGMVIGADDNTPRPLTREVEISHLQSVLEFERRAISARFHPRLAYFSEAFTAYRVPVDVDPAAPKHSKLNPSQRVVMQVAGIGGFGDTRGLALTQYLHDRFNSVEECRSQLYLNEDVSKAVITGRVLRNEVLLSTYPKSRDGVVPMCVFQALETVAMSTSWDVGVANRVMEALGIPSQAIAKVWGYKDAKRCIRNMFHTFHPTSIALKEVGLAKLRDNKASSEQLQKAAKRVWRFSLFSRPPDGFDGQEYRLKASFTTTDERRFNEVLRAMRESHLDRLVVPPSAKQELQLLAKYFDERFVDVAAFRNDILFNISNFLRELGKSYLRFLQKHILPSVSVQGADDLGSSVRHLTKKQRKKLQRSAVARQLSLGESCARKHSAQEQPIPLSHFLFTADEPLPVLGAETKEAEATQAGIERRPARGT